MNAPQKDSFGSALKTELRYLRNLLWRPRTAVILISCIVPAVMLYLIARTAIHFDRVLNTLGISANYCRRSISNMDIMTAIYINLFFIIGIVFFFGSLTKYFELKDMKNRQNEATTARNHAIYAALFVLVCFGGGLWLISTWC